MSLPIKILKIHPDASIPEYRTSGACGFDFTLIEDQTIQPREIVRLRTGLVFCVPPGHVLLIVSRSSLPMKRGLIVPQSVGIVDQDYCGPEDEILLQVQNITDAPVQVVKGDRLLQGLVVPVAHAQFEVADAFTNPTRGGFGTTG